jgi:hypothetical protein
MTGSAVTNGGRREPDPLWNQLANATALSGKQDQVTWTVFGLFWAANAGLVAGLVSAEKVTVARGVFACVAGFVTCWVWWVLQRRATGFLYFYDEVIRRLEQHLLKEQNQLALNGRVNTNFALAVKGLKARPLMQYAPLVVLALWLAASTYWVAPVSLCLAVVSGLLTLVVLVCALVGYVKAQSDKVPPPV